MSEKAPKVGRPAGVTYPRRLMVFLDEERFAALEAQSRRQRISKAQLVRDALDDAARRWRRERVGGSE